MKDLQEWLPTFVKECQVSSFGFTKDNGARARAALAALERGQTSPMDAYLLALHRQMLRYGQTIRDQDEQKAWLAHAEHVNDLRIDLVGIPRRST